MRLTGEYVLDLDATARAKVGPTRDRFLTEAGYEQAIARFVADNQEALATTRLTVTAEAITLQTAEGAEQFAIRRYTEKKGRTVLVIDWYGEDETFDVDFIDGGSVHLASEENELSEYVWKKA
ncbi:MAG: hypothetical protein ACAI43_04380 [Phycisphaerae bacterium]|nr:hypothetical protein [Tepidisphaeraceae bacterium]